MPRDHDRILIPRNLRQEDESRRAVESLLAPWLVDYVRQGHDFGRDVIVQVVEGADDASHHLSPLSFWLQLKSTRESFASTHREEFEVAHLKNWTGSGSPAVILCTWSKHDNRCRFRSARDAVRELGERNPNWVNQRGATVHFREEHAAPEGAIAREAIKRMLAAELSTPTGGESSLVVSDLFPIGTTLPGDIITTVSEGGGNPRTHLVGPGWQTGDLDARDVEVQRILVASLILADKVWIQFRHLGLAVLAFGKARVAHLVESGRLHAFEPTADVQFQWEQGDRHGELDAWRIRGDHREYLREWASRLHPSVSSDGGLRAMLVDSTLLLPAELADRAKEKTHVELGSDQIRAALGLPRRLNDGRERVWDANLVARLGHQNMYLGAATQLRARAVEFEHGLASLNGIRMLAFGRTPPVADVQRIMEGLELPDPGRLLAEVGPDRLFEIAQSQSASDFRALLWGLAAPFDDIGAVDLARLFPVLLRSHQTASEAVRQYPNQLRLLAGENSTILSRGVHGRDRLNTQRQLHHHRRLEKIAATVGRLPEPYDACPCGSGEKFKFCCGRRPS
ncbi:MAG: DUF4365 domain-containing protein [Deltaproteobacteria bacterium]|nr:DUF4365 domain-containing protein [Deltaproteobacteria bacterium]